jgi:hypothetical protein
MVAEAAPIPDPHTVWVRSTMMEAKIQSLVDRGLLRLKAEVECKTAVGEEFLIENVKEQVVFSSYFECGFNLPAGDFFRGLLDYYKLELVHFVLNSITVVLTLIHFCEAYLGISPHFLMWRHLICVKRTGKRSGPVGAVMFFLRSGLMSEWIDTDLPDNNTGWRSEWFYIADQLPGLPRCSGHKPVKISKWDPGLSSHEADDLKEVLELVKDLKNQGVTRASVARSFCRWLIQPIKDRVLPAYEYWGQSDPTHEVNCKVSKEEMAARVSQIYSRMVKIKKCPKAHSLKMSADPVSLGTYFRSVCSFYVLSRLTLLVIGCLQECECQFWCSTPLREGEQHRRKLRSDKYRPPAARLLEVYAFDSSVEADEDTDTEVDGDAGTGPDAAGAVTSRRKTRVAVAKQSTTIATAAVFVVKATEKKKKRKASPPPAVETPAIPMPQTREVESKEEEEKEATEEPPAIEEIGEPRCQEAAGIDEEDDRGCPPSRFGSAANCGCNTGKDAYVE